MDAKKPVLRFAHTIQVVVIPLYMACGAILLRALTYSYSNFPSLFPWYAGLELVFLFLFILVSIRPSIATTILQVIYVVQSIVILCMVSLPPHLDFITSLFTLLCYQMALVIHGKIRWVWCGIFCVLILISLVVWKGWILGLALSLIPIAGSIVILSYVIAYQEEEKAKLRSGTLLNELQEKNSQLQIYSTQVEQIAAIEERNRLARDLHDSVSQTIFSIVLNTRSTQILLEREPDRVRKQLEQLQILTQEALAEMRSIIAQLRL
jgi:signal transduction histidine kinase